MRTGAKIDDHFRYPCSISGIRLRTFADILMNYNMKREAKKSIILLAFNIFYLTHRMLLEEPTTYIIWVKYIQSSPEVKVPQADKIQEKNVQKTLVLDPVRPNQQQKSNILRSKKFTRWDGWSESDWASPMEPLLGSETGATWVCESAPS
jgi:hypothetical protein